jgi:hypothetical protein
MPLELLRSSTIDCFPRFQMWILGSSTVVPGRSTRITVAPRSASSIAGYGAGPSPASSTTRTPARGSAATASAGAGPV